MRPFQDPTRPLFLGCAGSDHERHEGLKLLCALQEKEIVYLGQMRTTDYQLIRSCQQLAHGGTVSGAHIKVDVEPPVPEGTNERFGGREIVFDDEETWETARRSNVRELQTHRTFLKESPVGPPESSGYVCEVKE